jgi:hypothetical protein
MNISKYRKFNFLKKEHCPIVLTISGAEEKNYSKKAERRNGKSL